MAYRKKNKVTRKKRKTSIKRGGVTVPRKKRKVSTKSIQETLRKNGINNQEALLLGVLHWLGLDYDFVGDGKLEVGGKFPDYISGDGKRIIEMYGTRWHKKSEEAERIAYFAKAGYRTLIIWSDELQFRRRKKLVKKILNFEHSHEDEGMV